MKTEMFCLSKFIKKIEGRSRETRPRLQSEKNKTGSEKATFKGLCKVVFTAKLVLPRKQH